MKASKYITKEDIQNLNNSQEKSKLEVMKKYKDKADMRIKPEDFMDTMDEKNLDEINRIMTDCLSSEHYRMKQFWRTLKRWYAWIEGFFSVKSGTFKFTNALTEWINNLCKVAKRQSHWFRLKSMYLKKLVARFCLTNLEF